MSVQRFITGALASTALFASAHGNVAAQNDGQKTAVGLPHSAPFMLGAQTHFGQTWSEARIEQLEKLDLKTIRDSISWGALEARLGDLAISSDKLEVFRKACQNDRHLLLTVIPHNRFYENNQLVASPEGQAAFLAYLEKLIDALPGCIDALEIGSVLNGEGALKVDEGADARDVYVDLLKFIYGPLKEKAPNIAILGGSSNVISTGFLNGLFERSMLDYVDGIAIQPFRDQSENIDWELNHLAEVMAQHGKMVPVWATAFSDNFDKSEEAAPSLLKTATLMAATGVERAYWYALVDQRWYRHMGLFTPAGRDKPASHAMSFLQTELLSHGRPVDMSPDRLTRVYRYGDDRWVIWGAPRKMRVAEGTRVYDAQGREIKGAVDVATAPIVVIGERPSFDDSSVLADSVFEFATAPWSYHALPDDGSEVDLGPLDERFTTRLGDRYLRPLFVSDMSGAVTGTRDKPTRIVVRYTAPKAVDARLQVCINPNSRGAGIGVYAGTTDRAIAAGSFIEPGQLASSELKLQAGDKIDVAFSPAGHSETGNTFDYRIKLIAADVPLPPCLPNIAGWTDG